MSISKERIERAAKAVAVSFGVSEKDWSAYTASIRTILTADAPALLAAKIEGLREARDLKRDRNSLVVPIAAIDRRIAELSSQEAGT